MLHFLHHKIFFIFLIGSVIIVGTLYFHNDKKQEVHKDISIAYFLGGRTSLLYRAYAENEFDTDNISVQFITHSLRDNSNYYILSKQYDSIENKENAAKATGEELLKKMNDGEAEGSTPGESSFIKGIIQGIDMVAVAELGHDAKDLPGHAIIFRTGVTIKKPEDIKGKTLVTRRSGPGDAIFLREFLNSIGIQEKDVTINDQVDDDEYRNQIISGEADGGYFHLTQFYDMVDNGQAYIYHRLDWVNPELSHALLVFRRDFIKDHPEIVEHIVRTYMKRIRFEQNITKENNPAISIKETRSNIQLGEKYGMNTPHYDLYPTVSIDLLNEMQDLMFKYHSIDKKADLRQYIDNSFVEKIYNEER